jgi:hypothetical protein
MSQETQEEAEEDRELVDGWDYDGARDRYVVIGCEGYSLERTAYKKLLPYQRRECLSVCLSVSRILRIYKNCCLIREK